MQAQWYVRLGWTGCIVAVLGIAAAQAPGQERILRPAHCAGIWYPDDKENLEEALESLFDGVMAQTIKGKPLALIVPHAGYHFSGSTAAAGYHALRGHSYKRVIVLAFSHRHSNSYNGIDIPRRLAAYVTPLGEVPIDRQACDALLKTPLFVSKPNVDEQEHSLELQLPYLQHLYGEFQLVPLLIGRMATSDFTAAAAELLKIVDDDTLLVASTDFTHYGPRYDYVPFSDDIPARLRTLADQAASPITLCDFDGFAKHIQETQDTICGRVPIMLLLRTLSMQGGAKGVRVKYATSGEITDKWTNSVTYQSFVFTRRPGTMGQDAQDALLKLARKTVTRQLTGKPREGIDPESLPAQARQDGACFVTLENHGELRGCIGNMVATGPLHEAVIRNGISACQDGRFRSNPVTARELDDLNIEISYLTPMQRVKDVSKIVVGQHGIQMVRGDRRGVLLPQVAYERGWTREEFLEHTCKKAGLPTDAWKQPDTEIYSFEAEVFSEPEPNKG